MNPIKNKWNKPFIEFMQSISGIFEIKIEAKEVNHSFAESIELLGSFSTI